MGGPTITRFAPSPTGHLHIGGARTALFNWALAHGRGSFLLRVEDTDRARSSDEVVGEILEDLAWLGIAWDEGPEWQGLGGDPRGVGPFFQSARVAEYDRQVARLIEADLAYPAFDTAEELDALRAAARAEKRSFRYRRPADWQREAALSRMAREEHVVRFRMPEEPVRVVDEILGEVEFGEDDLDDFVIRKRDGYPTYHLAMVVDDELMGVTHVLRGQEHLNNTPRHVALQRALGFRTPVYAHLPLIFNADGSKMSKRDKDKAVRAAARAALKEGALAEVVPADRLDPWLRDKKRQLDPADALRLAGALGVELPCIDVEDFRRAGYLPEVLCNFLALLGWSTGEKDAEGRDLERFDRRYLAERFSIERVGRTNARFDRDKLLAFNQDGIARLDDAEFFTRWSAWCARYAPEALRDRHVAWRERYAAMVRTRCRTLADPTSPTGPGAFALLADDALVYDEKAVAKWLRRGDPSGLALLRQARAVVEAVEEFEPEPIEAAVRAFCAERGIGLAKLAQPLRVAVTGSAASPPLGETLAILGRSAVLRRLDRCLALTGGG
jgi:glutamyl/glutaminyl-tRNA synthetase